MTKKTSLRERFAKHRNARQVVLEVGDELKDGTVCIAVDLQKQEALFAPKELLLDKAKFYTDAQNAVVDAVNEQGVHGHKDWRRVTDPEGTVLAHVWNSVAPRKLQGSNAEHFWLGSSYGPVGYSRDSIYPVSNFGLALRAGEGAWPTDKDSLHWVPVVRDHNSHKISVAQLSTKSRIKAAKRPRTREANL